jgi:hypothetical protein
MRNRRKIFSVNPNRQIKARKGKLPVKLLEKDKILTMNPTMRKWSHQSYLHVSETKKLNSLSRDRLQT